MTEPILLIRTGGTIDAAPYDDPRHPPPVVDTLADNKSMIVETINRLTDRSVHEVSWFKTQKDRLIKDSQLFTAAELSELAQFIKTKNGHRFIITHGTDSMVKNALIVRQELGQAENVVVFVGAMVPLSMHHQHPSDGVAALAFAIERITDLTTGVYIVGRDLNAKRLTLFDPDNAQKDYRESLASLTFTLSDRQSSLQSAPERLKP